MIDQSVFHEPGYLAHNAARLEHLASLNLPLSGRTVLEVGAGVGDHTPFFLERGCRVTVTDGRQENVDEILRLHPDWDARVFDVENEGHYKMLSTVREVIYCYGLLYHCQFPITVLRNLSRLEPDLLLLETCVSPTEGGLAVKNEDRIDPRCSIHGTGTRIPRSLIREQLKMDFPFVYVSVQQPNHQEFPLDWNQPITGEARAVFIASTTDLNNPLLTTELPLNQTICASQVRG